MNTRIRKAIKKGAKVFAIGEETDLTYKVEWLGNDLDLLGKLPKAVAEAFASAQRPMVIVGGGALKGGHGAALEARRVARTSCGTAGTASTCCTWRPRAWAA